MPSAAIEQGHGKSLKEVFFATSNIRHFAVHRLHTSTTSIKNLVNAAVLFTETLKDAERPAVLKKIQEQLADSIDEVMRHQNLLERKLSDELNALAKKRAELDELERLAVEEMVTNDRKNRKSAGQSMDGFLSELWHDLGYCAGDQSGPCQGDVSRSENGIDSSEPVKPHHESQHENEATPVHDHDPEVTSLAKAYLSVEDTTQGYPPTENDVPAEDCSPPEDYAPVKDTPAHPDSPLFASASTSYPMAAPSSAGHRFPVTSTSGTLPTPPPSTPFTVGLRIIHGPILLTEIVSLSSLSRSCILAKAQAIHLKHHAEQEGGEEEAPAVQSIWEYILRSVHIGDVDFSLSTYDHEDLTSLVSGILPRFTVELIRIFNQVRWIAMRDKVRDRVPEALRNDGRACPRIQLGAEDGFLERKSSGMGGHGDLSLWNARRFSYWESSTSLLFLFSFLNSSPQ
ncbi:hypothetical protein MMC18_004281 [Xylographa bjoerkii]|nr:hypothetical protein [Xylographa bjoerkii]